jgi:hypothetical protein
MTHIDPITRLFANAISLLLEERKAMSAQVDALKVSVANLSQAVDAVAAKNEDLKAQLAVAVANAVDPADAAALVELTSQVDALADKIASA